MTVPDGWHTGGRGDLTGTHGTPAFVRDRRQRRGEACTAQGTIERLLGPGVDDLVTFRGSAVD